MDVLAGMLQEDDLRVEMNPTERPADSYHTTEIMQQRYELEGESQGIPQGCPHFSSSSSGYVLFHEVLLISALFEHCSCTQYRILQNPCNTLQP